MRVTGSGVSLWYGTPDAPAPSGIVAPGADTTVSIGLQPPDPAARITVLYRINHGSPQIAAASVTHQDPSGKQYFKASLVGCKAGDNVEYVAIYRSGSRQLPSTQEAESHVTTFKVGPEPAAASSQPATADHPAPAAATAVAKHPDTALDSKEELRAALHASGALNSKTLEDSFIQLYFEHTGGAEEFWTSLRGHAEFKPHIERLQFVLQVDLLVSGHLPLIEALLKLPGVSSMRDLARLQESSWHQLVVQTGAPTHLPGGAPAAQAQLLIASILATLQAAFPTVAVERIAAASGHVDKLAQKFLENSADLDIRTARLDTYAADHSATVYKGIPESHRAAVLKEVKRLQRLLSVSTNAATFRGLLQTSLDSAHAIALIPRATFVSHYGQSLGGETAAAGVHERAQFINARNINLRSSIHDAIHTPATRGLGHHSQKQMLRTYAPRGPSVCPPDPHQSAGHLNFKPGSLKEDLVKRFPNSEELFGAMSLCKCEECKSAIGPAAYFVDVLDFLGHSKPNEHGATPLDVLIGDARKGIPGRRPDLAYLTLTCANTNTAMPYVDIVNEILEAYVSLNRLEGSAARDTGDATTAELDANPQHINQHAYEVLDRAVFPFQLPFSRPLAVARAYLGQLGTGRQELLLHFQKDPTTALVRHLLATEQLGMSAEEFQIVTRQSVDPAQKPYVPPEAELYGYHGMTLEHPGGAGAGSQWTSELGDVGTFLRHSGLSYAELDALVATVFVNPHAPTGWIAQLLKRMPISHSALITLLKSNLTHPAEALATLALADISAQDLEPLKGAALAHLRKTIVIDDPEEQCNPSLMRLRHFDGTALDGAVLGRMQRFIRLYRRSGWSVTDLDRALSALRAVDTTAEVVVQLAQVKALQTRFQAKNLQTLLALWGPIEARGADCLYRSLFLNKAMQRQGALIDAAFAQEFVDSPVLTRAEARLLDHLPVLQTALRISALDMELLLEDCGLNTTSTVLDLANVSALYRRVVLAKALHLKVRDFIELKALWGADPFVSPEATLEFTHVAVDVGHSGLTCGKLSYLLRHVTGLPAGEHEPQPTAILTLARALREGLTAIARDNSYTRDPRGMARDPNGSVTAQKLALVFDPSVVDEFVGIVNGTVSYSVSLIALPVGVSFPAELQKKLSYDPVAQLFTCKCPLTEVDRTTLYTLSSDTVYRAAVDSLYNQPLDLVVSLTQGFVEPNDAQKMLVTGNPSLDADLNPIQLDSHGTPTSDPAQVRTTVIATKFEYVLSRLLPYLVTTLGAALVKQTVADSVGIGAATAQVLLADIKSTSDATRQADYDLHALNGTGLDATYGGGAASGTAGGGAIDHTISFDGFKRALPSGTTSASWRGWVSALSAGDFEFIVRTSGTATVWFDDPQTPLAGQPSGADEWVCQKTTLKARQLYYLRVDVSQLPPNGGVTLLWQSSSVHKSVVPTEALCPSSVIEAFRQTYLRLHKAGLLVSGLKLADDEVTFLGQTIGSAEILNFNLLPVSRSDSLAQAIDALAPRQFRAFLRAARLVAFRKDLPDAPVKLTKLFSTTRWDAAMSVLGCVTGWDAKVLRDLTSGFGLSLVDFQEEHWVLRLAECVRLAQRLGVAPPDLFAWATAGWDYATLEKIGQAVKKCVQAQYDDDTWLTVAKPLNDGLRDAQRKALIAYLLPRMRMRESDELFEYFLIDPDMGVCTETSRISLAHSSVQLFVQRCLMSLENTGDVNTVRPDQIDSDQWETWRKHYRYWKANYEVLLTPEHWMEQSLRDDKTPFFVALEGDLTQQEVTAENVEQAYLHYLDKLQQVARLEIIGTFWQDKDPDTGDELNILHVFGRTFHAPHTFFYRQLVNFMTWTPWEEMQVSIEGDHLMPMIWNRRLYVFWPVFSKKAVPPDTKRVDATSTSIDLKSSTPFWQVGLAWSELKHGKWSAKQLSKKAFDMGAPYFVEDDPGRYARYAYSFKTSMVPQPDGGPPSLIIRCVFHGPTVSVRPWAWFFFIEIKETTEVVGAFEIGGCNGESVEPVFGTMPWPNPVVPPEADVEALTYVLAPHKSGLTLTSAANHHSNRFLEASPTPYRLLYPHQFSDYLLQAPLFYQDKHCTFLASPHEEDAAIHKIANPGRATFQRASTVAASRGKTAASHHAAAGQRAAGSHAASPQGSPRPPRHAAPTESSEALVKIEQMLKDVSESYSQQAAARGSAWGAHAVGHNTHAPAAVTLRFETFYHPFVCDFMKSITRSGVAGLLTEANQRREAHEKDFFAHHYKPGPQVARPLPRETVDFDDGPYAIYNQELFYHIPDLIHERCRQNRRYEESLRWLRFIFDPTDDSPYEAAPERYWKYLPLKTSARENVQQLLTTMESGDEKHSQLIADWAKNPFRPYAVARHRLDAYKKNIFIKYVKTLIDQADDLFRSDLKEAINEAQQLYIMALHLLGPKPETIASHTQSQAECYASLRGKLDTHSAGLALLENEFPFSGKVTSHPKTDSGGMQHIGRTLYFCSPPNTKLLELWRIVEDRLYKIRHCMNIEGVVRQLALFDPAIDPGMLVRAAAAGIDLSSAMAEVQTPLPAYRFNYMLQKAREFCNECRSFGSGLLSALEKHDGEALAVMRATHEVGILDLAHRVKLRQLDEANAQIDSITASRNSALERYGYYRTLVGLSGGGVPEVGETIPLLPVPSQPGTEVFGIQLIPEEALELTLSTTASVLQLGSSAGTTLAAALSAIPQIGAHAQPMGPGASVTEGGSQIGAAANSAASTLKTLGEIAGIAGSLAGKMGGYFRRQAENTHQHNLAACEIMQIDKQLAAANIRVEVAQRELESHEKQMDNSRLVLDFMTQQKFTTQEMYSWMVSDTASTYFSCYQTAVALARKAERTFRFERGVRDSSFIQFGYWDSLRKGLLAADRLYLALMQMDAAYTNQNVRGYEISRDVSMLLNAPLALIALKATGTCEIEIPESFFDADYPGHYMRRIKSVSLTIPCVVGPYTGINCKLTLLSNKTRVSSDPGDSYAEDVENGDDRFINNFVSTQSIATSHGLNDSGMFEVNFRDERYLPFEGAGVITRWRLDLRKQNNPFDLDKLSDVVFHFKYISTEGGEPLRHAAQQALDAPDSPLDLLRLISVCHEYPGEWYRFLNPNPPGSPGQTLTFALDTIRFPYRYRGKTIVFSKIELFLSWRDVYDRQIYVQDGTPAGDYSAGKPLQVSVRPPGGTAVKVPLKSDKMFMRGMPHGVADVENQGAGLGTWTVAVQAEDLAALGASLRTRTEVGGDARLKSEVVADLILVCHYALS